MTTISIQTADSLITKMDWTSSDKEYATIALQTGNDGYYFLIMAQFASEAYVHPDQMKWREWLNSADTFTRMAGYYYLMIHEGRDSYHEEELNQRIHLDVNKVNNWVFWAQADKYIYTDPELALNAFRTIYSRNKDFSLVWYWVAQTFDDLDSSLSLYTTYALLYQDNEHIVRIFRYLYSTNRDSDLIPKLRATLSHEDQYYTLMQCYLYFIEEKYEECITLAHSFNYPEYHSDQIQSMLGWSAMHMGKFDIARACFEQTYMNSELRLAARDMYAYFFFTKNEDEMKELVLDMTGGEDYYNELKSLLTELSSIDPNDLKNRSLEFHKKLLFQNTELDEIPFLMRIYYSE
ncbi:MAG: hypothetical protein ACK5W1_02040 [Flavobacteriales bacterium]